MTDWASVAYTLLQVGIIIAITAAVALLASWAIGRALSRSSPQVITGARRTGVAVVALAGTVLLVQQLGVSPDILLLIVLLAGAGALVATRVPLENLAGKYFADVYVPFKLGDRVEISGQTGQVIEVNSMCTVLLTDDHQIASIPNARFMREVLVNTTPQAWKELLVPVTVGPGVDLPALESEVLKSLSKIRLRLDPRFPPVLTTRSQNSTSSDLVLRVMIRRPEDRDAILAEVNQRVSAALDKVQAVRRPTAAPAA
jgi:small conductance mechanosensitive channel